MLLQDKYRQWTLSIVLASILWSLLVPLITWGQDALHSEEPAPEPRWHLPRRQARPDSRSQVYPHQDRWHPLAKPMRSLKTVLKDVGITFDLDFALLDQHASKVQAGHRTVGTFFWELMGDWELLRLNGSNDGYLSWNIFGGAGLNYDNDSESLSDNVGSISLVNLSDTFKEPAIVDELCWKQKLINGLVIILAGMIDMADYFDTNRAANNMFQQFNAASLMNTLSIPFSAYGGFGGVIRATVSDDLYVMFGIGDASVASAVAPWQTVDNNSWYQLLEIGLTRTIKGLGKGTYRLIPWHNHLFGADGWGISLNIDQELGHDGLMGFIRLGVGDEDVTSVKTFVSGGLALNGPFGRQHDTVAIGMSWADPSPGAGIRDETLLEVYYRLRLTPSMFLAPNLQVVLEPGTTRDYDTVVVGGIRLTIQS